MDGSHDGVRPFPAPVLQFVENRPDDQRAETSPIRSVPARAFRGDWRQSVATALWTGLILLVVVIYSQRFAGELEPPNSAWVASLIIATALVPSLFAWSLCRVERQSQTNRSSRMIRVAVTLIPPFLLGCAFLSWNSATTLGILALMLGVTSVAMSLAPKNQRHDVPAQSGRAIFSHASGTVQQWTHAVVPPRPVSIFMQAFASLAGELEVAMTENLENDEKIAANEVEARTLEIAEPPRRTDLIELDAETNRHYSQQLVRSDSADRGDVLEGSVKVTFAVGQRQANIHIPFVPPFATVPSIECESIDGCEVRLKIGTIQTFGTRIEVRRTESIGEVSTAEIGFAAVAEHPQANAA